MIYKFRINHFNISAVIWSNIITKYATICVVIGILVLVPYDVKVDKFLSSKAKPESMNSSTMFAISLNKNAINRSPFNFENRALKFYEILKKSVCKCKCGTFKLISSTTAFAEDITEDYSKRCCDKTDNIFHRICLHMLGSFSAMLVMIFIWYKWFR